MEMDKYEMTIMNLVCQGGNARSLAMEAIQAAKSGDFEKADALLAESGTALLGAHQEQTDSIQNEVRGGHLPVMLLMVHAQDHLMDAMVIKDMAQEFIELYKRIKPEV